MADITDNAAITSRRLRMPQLRFPRFALGASFDAVIRLVGDASIMAYAGPLRGVRRQAQVVSDSELEGRDPNW